MDDPEVQRMLRRVTELEGKVVATQTRLDALEKSDAEQHSHVPDVANSTTNPLLATQQEEINTLKTDCDELAKIIAKWSEQLDSLSSKVDSLPRAEAFLETSAWKRLDEASETLEKGHEDLLQILSAINKRLKALESHPQIQSPSVPVAPVQVASTLKNQQDMFKIIESLSKRLTELDGRVSGMAQPAALTPEHVQELIASSPAVTELSQILFEHMSSAMSNARGEVLLAKIEGNREVLDQAVQKATEFRADLRKRLDGMASFAFVSNIDVDLQKLRTSLGTISQQGQDGSLLSVGQIVDHLTQHISELRNAFEREVRFDLVHDVNLLWDYVRGVTDPTHRIWKQPVPAALQSQEEGDSIVLGARPRVERPTHRIPTMTTPPIVTRSPIHRTSPQGFGSEVQEEPSFAGMPDLPAVGTKREPSRGSESVHLRDDTSSVAQQSQAGESSPAPSVITPQSTPGGGLNLPMPPKASTPRGRKSIKSSPQASPRASSRTRSPVDYNVDKASRASAKGEVPFARVAVMRVPEGEDVMETLRDFDERHPSHMQDYKLPAALTMSNGDYLRSIMCREKSPHSSGLGTPSYTTLSGVQSNTTSFDDELRAAFAANIGRDDEDHEPAWPVPARNLFAVPSAHMNASVEGISLPFETPKSTYAEAVASEPERCTSDSDKPKLRRVRARKARGERRAEMAKHAPEVDPKLKAVIPSSIKKHFKHKEYAPSAAEMAQREAFFEKSPTLVSLLQKDCVTSLHLFSPDDLNYIRPRTVLVDTGAEVRVMISPKLATDLGLTWTKDSAKLVGIGGLGGGDGYSKERINVRLGGFVGKKGAGPADGCFAISLRPMIMQQSAVDDLGYDVILGQGFLRACLGSVDNLKETLDYSPAWMSHACAEFRCSIPCEVSKPIPSSRVLWARLPNLTTGSEEFEPLSTLLACPVKHHIRDAPAVSKGRKVHFEAGTGEPAVTPKEVKDGAKTTWPPSSSPSDSETRSPRVIPAALHPGFPQTGIPTKEAYAKHRDELSARRRSDDEAIQQTMIEARARQSERLAHVVSPVSISYAVKDLQSSGRLMDGFKLDLSPGQVLSESQIQLIVDMTIGKLQSAPIPRETVNIDINETAPAATETSAATAEIPLRRSPRGAARASVASVAISPPMVRAAVVAVATALLPRASATATPLHTLDVGPELIRDTASLLAGILLLLSAVTILPLLVRWLRARHSKSVRALILSCATCVVSHALVLTDTYPVRSLVSIIGAWLALVTLMQIRANRSWNLVSRS